MKKTIFLFTGKRVSIFVHLGSSHCFLSTYVLGLRETQYSKGITFNCFYYLFIRHIPYPYQETRRRELKKRIEAEGESIHPDPGSGCAYGERRKEQKIEGKTKERNREWDPNPATWTS